MAKEILASYDFKGAGQIIGALYEPRPDDPSTPSAGQGWFNTVLKRWRMNDGTVSFSMLRTDGDDVYTGVLTFNPGSQSRPFDVASGKTDVVTNLNSDRVDSFHASQSVTVSTVAVRDASGRLSVADPTSAEHAATKAYVDSVAAGQDRKAPCRVATTTTLPSYTHSSGILTATANGAFPTTDGITVAINERVLVKDESGANEKYNGIFTLTTVGDASNPWVLTRATDADVDAEVTSGMTTFILEGSANAGFGFTLITPDPITLGTTALEFVVSSSSTSYTAGNGIVFDGATIHFGKSTAYSIGDIPYCGSSSAISFLAAGANNYVLKATGTGTAPVFASVNSVVWSADTVWTNANDGTGSGLDADLLDGQHGSYYTTATNMNGLTPSRIVLSDASGNLVTDSFATYDATNKTFSFGGTAGSTERLKVVGRDVAVDASETNFFKILFASGQNDYNIASGVTDSGYRIAVDASIFVNDTDFEGTLTQQIAVWARHGAFASNAGSVITSSYGVYIDTLTTANTTITNLWGLYQANSSAKNYFGGNVGVGTTSLTDKLNVAGNIRLADGAARSIIGPANEDLKIISSPDTATEGIKWYVDGGTTPGMVLMQTGKLGIGGGVVPSELVHLYTGAAQDIKLRMDSNSTGSAYLELDRQTSAGKVGIILQDGTVTKWTFGDLNGNNSFVFDSASVSDALVILQDGKIGVGIATPKTTLELYRTGSMPVITVGRYDTNPSDAAALDLLEYNASGGGVFGSANAFGFRFKLDGSINALLIQSGNGASINTRLTLDRDTGSLTLDGQMTISTINSSSSNSVLCEASGVVQKRTIPAGAWTGESDTLDGQHGSYYLDLANSTGDTDDVDEGVSNLYFTNARARSALAGTADRITYTSATGVIDIASTYVGQATITTIGTITTGTWNATAIGSAYGGTGITTYTVGDLIYCSATNTLAKRGIGSNGNFFRVSGGLPVWSTADTDAITEGSNLYFTNARARSALSSAGATEIAYDSGTGVIGLGSQAGLVKTFSVGDGVSLEYTLTHNFGTRYVGACTRRDSGNYDEVEVESECLTDNKTKIRFSQAPSTNQFKVILFAAHG